jgi:hypothetical protein
MKSPMAKHSPSGFCISGILEGVSEASGNPDYLAKPSGTAPTASGHDTTLAEH